MLNKDRLSQLTNLMAERGWDLLLLYGHTWRKGLKQADAGPAEFQQLRSEVPRRG